MTPHEIRFTQSIADLVADLFEVPLAWEHPASSPAKPERRPDYRGKETEAVRMHHPTLRMPNFSKTCPKNSDGTQKLVVSSGFSFSWRVFFFRSFQPLVLGVGFTSQQLGIPHMLPMHRCQSHDGTSPFRSETKVGAMSALWFRNFGNS